MAKAKRTSKKAMPEDTKFYELVHPGAPSGIVLRKPRMRKQDKRAKSCEMYTVVFFPKITGIGTAQVSFYGLETLSQSPEAAKAKFMDRIAKSETWKTYAHAGHRVRRVKVLDLGDA